MMKNSKWEVHKSRRLFLQQLGATSALLGMGAGIEVVAETPFAKNQAGFLIDANKIALSFDPFWANFKFHPTEYLSNEWGRDLMQLLKDSGAAQQYVRLYNQPEDACRVDADGKISYDWKHFDERADFLLKLGLTPMVSFYAMPREIAANPELGRERPFLDGKFVCYSPPRDYTLWADLCSDFTRHVLEKYGEKEVLKWYFTGWNEPDLSSFWHKADTKEYEKLYDYFALGVKRVNPEIKIGGPAFSSTKTFKDPDPWREFLRHVTTGTNNATGKVGTPIDYLAIHTYGGSGAAGSVRFDHPSVDYMLEQQMMLASIRDEFPSLKGMPMFVAEWGGSSSGSKGMDEEPMAEFRNTHYAAAFLAALVSKHLALRNSARDLNIAGLMLCLSGYEKASKRDFEGKRTLHTLNGFHKPLLNAYKALSKLGNDLVFAGTDPSNSEINMIISREGEKRVTVLAVNYQPNQVKNQGAEATLQLDIEMPWRAGTKVEIRHWRIDERHSNGYTAYREAGSPLKPSQEQRKMIEDRMNLTMLTKPERIKSKKKHELNITLPSNAVSLIEIIKAT